MLKEPPGEDQETKVARGHSRQGRGAQVEAEAAPDDLMDEEVSRWSLEAVEPTGSPGRNSLLSIETEQ